MVSITFPYSVLRLITIKLGGRDTSKKVAQGQETEAYVCLLRLDYDYSPGFELAPRRYRACPVNCLERIISPVSSGMTVARSGDDTASDISMRAGAVPMSRFSPTALTLGQT